MENELSPLRLNELLDAALRIEQLLFEINSNLKSIMRRGESQSYSERKGLSEEEEAKMLSRFQRDK